MDTEPRSNVGLYLGALLILALLEVTFALGINALRPDKDNSAIMIMVGTVLVPMVTSIINIINGERAKSAAVEAAKKASATHDLVNGQSEEIKRISRAEGVAAGVAAGTALHQNTPPTQVVVANPPSAPVPVTHPEPPKE